MPSRRAVVGALTAGLAGCPRRVDRSEAEPTETLYIRPDDEHPDLIVRNRLATEVSVEIELLAEGAATPAETRSYEPPADGYVTEARLALIRDGGTLRATVRGESDTVSVDGLNQNSGIYVNIRDEGVSASYRVV